MKPPARPDDLLEADFQRKHVIPAAQLLGYVYYHTHRSVKSPSGFPDLVLVGRRTVFVELKREKSNPTAAQTDWLTRLHQAGAEVYLVRPRNLDDLVTVLAAPTSGPRNGTLAQAQAWARLEDELHRHITPDLKETAA